MKLYLVILLLCVTSALCSACANPRSTRESTKTSNVILDISTEAYGPVYPTEGYILDFRLYDNGVLEYDDYPDQNSPNAKRGNIALTRKETTLSADDVRELVNIAQQPGFLEARPEYPPLRIATDATFTQTIIYRNQGREKRIVVVDYAPGDADAKSYYPAALVRLMQRTCQMKAKATGKSDSYCKVLFSAKESPPPMARQRTSLTTPITQMPE